MAEEMPKSEICVQEVSTPSRMFWKVSSGGSVSLPLHIVNTILKAKALETKSTSSYYFFSLINLGLICPTYSFIRQKHTVNFRSAHFLLSARNTMS